MIWTGELKIKLGPSTKSSDFDNEGQTLLFQLYKDGDDSVIDNAKETEQEPTPISIYNYICTEVTLHEGDKMILGTVKSLVKDNEGDPIGVGNWNPIHDTRVYEVEFTNGGQIELGVNVFAE